jgi:hypothetical protein
VIRLFDGYWIWLRVTDKISKPISGKYLFFSEDKDKLLEMKTLPNFLVSKKLKVMWIF